VIRAVVARTLAVLLVAAAWSPRPVRADAVVGTGAAGSCTEAALDSALAGGGNITFNCGGAATITVTSTKGISADTTIDGGGVITISGGNSVGVFAVSTGVNFTVQNLTIANGNSAYFGGGIYNDGTVTVTNSTFSGNTSANPEYGGAGGGIYSGGGPLTVTNSTFSGNSAANGVGGGIYGWGALTVTNSTFAGNSAYEGGGIYNYGGLTVTNSTFSGNSAAGGGGICNDGVLTVTNTIVANSTSGGNCYGGVTSDGGYNIDDGTTCGFTGTGCTTTTGTSFCNTNPVLAPTGLNNNGGPTQTIALRAGSPAIDAGSEAVCAASPVNNLDQRGYVRPGTGATNCSIGAYEYDSPGPAATPTRSATPTVTPTATRTPTPPPVVQLRIGTGRGRPGDAVPVTVSLDTAGVSIAATVNEISFGTDAPLSLDPSTCTVNPLIGKSLTAGAIGNGVFRFLVEPGNSVPIPDGPLYTCTFRIGPLALPGQYYLWFNGNLAAFSPSGLQVPYVVGVGGAITVSLVEPCVGDCDGNGQVTVDEVLTMVNIALGNADISTCTAGDANADGQITVNEILTAVNNALNGCAG
jgi:hypothetical protein